VRSLFEWLAGTPGSVALHESHYAYLVILTFHVLTLCLFVGTAAIIDLRLLGLTMRHVRVSEVIDRLLPWSAAGFAIMLLSGALLFYASPLSRYENFFFRAKMAALALAGLNVWVFHSRIGRGIAGWDADPVPPRAARISGALGLASWAVLIMLGRLIPYQTYWFDCNERPEPVILNLLAGCRP
jgi:hypothetical protein